MGEHLQSHGESWSRTSWSRRTSWINCLEYLELLGDCLGQHLFSVPFTSIFSAPCICPYLGTHLTQIKNGFWFSHFFFLFFWGACYCCLVVEDLRVADAGHWRVQQIHHCHLAIIALLDADGMHHILSRVVAPATLPKSHLNQHLIQRHLCSVLNDARLITALKEHHALVALVIRDVGEEDRGGRVVQPNVS